MSNSKNPTSVQQKQKKTVLRHHQCQYCDKTFDNTTDKRRHELVHTGDKPYQCQYCEKCFNRVDNKRRHELGHVKGKGELPHNCAYCAKFTGSDGGHDCESESGNPNQCATCDKIFTRPCLRRTHEQYAHSEDKPHKCQFCSMCFVWESQKKKHEESHSQQRSHTCQVCSKSFKNLYHLKHHERTHSGERNHKCQFCEKAFLRQADKNIHEKRHTGEKPQMCQYCGMCFTGTGSLKYHEMIHTGEKPHKCKFCDKCFITSRNLRRHEMVHTGEKPFQCKYCGKGFITRRNRDSHEGVHTKHAPGYKSTHDVSGELSKFGTTAEFSAFGMSSFPSTSLIHQKDLLPYGAISTSMQNAHPVQRDQPYPNQCAEFSKTDINLLHNTNRMPENKSVESI